MVFKVFRGDGNCMIWWRQHDSPSRIPPIRQQGFFPLSFFLDFIPRPLCVCVGGGKRGRLVQGFSVYCILRYGSPRKRLWPGAYYSMLAVSSGALRVAADISGRTETGLKSCVEVETST